MLSIDAKTHHLTVEDVKHLKSAHDVRSLINDKVLVKFVRKPMHIINVSSVKSYVSVLLDELIIMGVIQYTKFDIDVEAVGNKLTINIT